jgi:hypothetical protein
VCSISASAVKASPAGCAAFARHGAFLKAIIAGGRAARLDERQANMRFQRSCALEFGGSEVIAERVGASSYESQRAPYETISWLVILAFATGVAVFAWTPTPIAQGLAALGVAAAFAHAALNYGVRDALAFFAICALVVSTIATLLATVAVFLMVKRVIGARAEEKAA